MYLQFALQIVEAVLELGVRRGHLGQFGFEHGVVLFPEGQVLSRCCQASLERRVRTHGWAVTHSLAGPCPEQHPWALTGASLCAGLGQLPPPAPGL